MVILIKIWGQGILIWANRWKAEWIFEWEFNIREEYVNWLMG